MNTKLILAALLSLVAMEISQIEPSSSAPKEKSEQKLSSISVNTGKSDLSTWTDIVITKNSKGYNELSWQMGTAKTESFLIQRSVDGKKFKTIGRRGSQQNASSYSFEDAGFKKQAYYRIIEVDVDGKVLYSEAVSSKK